MEALESTALIEGLIAEADAVRTNTNSFDAWSRKCRTVLDRIFGPESQQSTDLMNVNFRFHGACLMGDSSTVTCY
jgi:hypothetical protein